MFHVHFQFDKYGHALINMRKGLKAPLSEKYNNFFTNCMGSPIRSGLWGVICAGMSDLATYFIFKDANVDYARGEAYMVKSFLQYLKVLDFKTQTLVFYRKISFIYSKRMRDSKGCTLSFVMQIRRHELGRVKPKAD